MGTESAQKGTHQSKGSFGNWIDCTCTTKADWVYQKTIRLTLAKHQYYPLAQPAYGPNVFSIRIPQSCHSSSDPSRICKNVANHAIRQSRGLQRCLSPSGQGPCIRIAADELSPKSLLWGFSLLGRPKCDCWDGGLFLVMGFSAMLAGSLACGQCGPWKWVAVDLPDVSCIGW